MSGNLQLSHTFKLLIGVILLGGVALFVFFNQQQKAFEAQQVPSEDLKSLQGLNRTQVETHETWCQKNKKSDEELNACVNRRQNRIKLLKLHGECATEQAKLRLQGMTSDERQQLTHKILEGRGISAEEYAKRVETKEKSQDQKNDVSRAGADEEVTEQELLVKIKEKLPEEMSKAATQCTYQKLCKSQGVTDDQLSTCVEKLQNVKQ